MESHDMMDPQRREYISTLGMIIFLATEAMMFATLIATYIVLRAGYPVWPPAGAPHLPVLLTSINTVILLSSSIFAHFALHQIKKGRVSGLIRHLGITAALGSVFLGMQVVEWTRLIHEGLTLKTGAYGSTFFTITGFHGLHVLIGILLLLFLLVQSLRKKYTQQHHTQVKVISMYWHFVDVVWIVVFTSLYLA